MEFSRDLIRPEDVPDVISSIARGATRVSRDISGFDIGASVVVFSLLHHRRSALGANRNEMPARHAPLLLPLLPAPLRTYQHLDARSRRRHPDQVPDRLVEDLTIFGSAEHCRGRLDAFRAAGITLPIVYPIHADFRGYAGVRGAYPDIYNTIRRLAPLLECTLELSPEARLLQDSVAGFFSRHLPPDAVYELDQEGTLPQELWQQMAANGWTALPVPADYGGVGADVSTAAVLHGGTRPSLRLDRSRLCAHLVRCAPADERW